MTPPTTLQCGKDIYYKSLIKDLLTTTHCLQSLINNYTLFYSKQEQMVINAFINMSIGNLEALGLKWEQCGKDIYKAFINNYTLFTNRNRWL